MTTAACGLVLGVTSAAADASGAITIVQTVDGTACTSTGTSTITFTAPASGCEVALGTITGISGAVSFASPVTVDIGAPVVDLGGPSQLTFDSELTEQVGAGLEFGNVSFLGAVDLQLVGVSTEGSLEVNGNATVGASITTKGAQNYSGSVTVTNAQDMLGNLMELSAADIEFGQAVSGSGRLLVEGSQVSFYGPVATASLFVDGTSEFYYDGDSSTPTVQTTNGQGYNGGIELFGNATFADPSGLISFGGVGVSPAASPSAPNVTIDGSAAFGGVGSSAQPIGSLMVTGTSSLGDGAKIITDGEQNYEGAVTMQYDDYMGVGQATLEDESPDGEVTFGAGVSGNAILNVAASDVDFNGTINTGGVAVTGATTLSSDVATVGYGQSYAGPVTLTRDTTLTDTCVTIMLSAPYRLNPCGTIDLDGAVTGPYALRLDGNSELNGQIGTAAAPLASVDSNADADQVTLNADVHTSGAQRYGALQPGGAVTLTGKPVDAASVALGGNSLKLDPTGPTVTFSGPVVGPGTLTLDPSDGLTLASPFSGGAALVVAGGDVRLTGATAGAIRVNGGARLDVHGGTTSGTDTVTDAATLSCTAGGTISGQLAGGGTLESALTAPTGVNATPGDGEATVSFTPGNEPCHPVSYTVAASPGGSTASGTGSPITVGGLVNGTQYTFTVTATDPLTSATSGASAPSAPQLPTNGANTSPPAVVAPPSTGAPSTTTPRRAGNTKSPKHSAVSGSLSATKLGLVKLGGSWAGAKRAYRGGSARGRAHLFFFALSEGSITIGSGSPGVLRGLEVSQRKALKGRVVWTSTTSGHYTLRGLQMGATLASVRRTLPHGQLFRVGGKQWYVASYDENAAVVELADGRVSALGIALRAVTRDARADRALLRSLA